MFFQMQSSVMSSYVMQTTQILPINCSHCHCRYLFIKNHQYPKEILHMWWSQFFWPPSPLFQVFISILLTPPTLVSQKYLPTLPFILWHHLLMVPNPVIINTLILYNAVLLSQVSVDPRVKYFLENLYNSWIFRPRRFALMLGYALPSPPLWLKSFMIVSQD